MNLSCFAAISTLSIASSVLAVGNVPADSHTVFDGTELSSTWDVAGWLEIIAGDFSPDTLTIVGGINPSDGLVDVNGGSFGPGAIDLQSGGRLNLNIGGSAGTVTNDGTIRAAVGPFAITTLNNIGSLHTTATGATISITNYNGTGGEQIGGIGTVSVTNIGIGVGVILPGDLDVSAPAVGTLTVESADTLTMSLLTINIADLGSLTADKLLVTGSVSLASAVLNINGAADTGPTIDADGELTTGAEFIILDSTAALTDEFAGVAGDGLEVRNGSNDLIGNFTVDYRESLGQVVLVYQPVPEPAGLMLVAGALGMFMRRRVRH